MAVEPYCLTATGALKAFDAGTLTVEEYAKSLLKRIEERDHTVKAWAHLNSAHVLEQARRLDQIPKSERGPMHGVAVAVKDVIHTKGMPTQHNSPIYESDQPELDAASIMTLRKAGAIIIGKTTTTEFAAIQTGPATTNPHDPTRTPGGSSSGSGAAVADFQAAVALGTQTGGSTIRPGSFNGIFAMKPTWNAISREGQKMYSVNLDTLGLFTRSVDDLELLGRVLGLADDDAPTPFVDGVAGQSFAFLKTMMWESVGPGTRDAMERGMELLKSAGAQVEEITFSAEFAMLPEWQACIFAGDGRNSFRAEYLFAKDKLAPSLVKVVEQPPSHKDYLAAYDGVAGLRGQWDAIAARYVAVVVPSVPDEAPKGLEFTGSAIFNSIWTALHAPVVNIPGFRGENGMPIGLSLVQQRYKDEALLSVAKEVAKVWQVSE